MKNGKAIYLGMFLNCFLVVLRAQQVEWINYFDCKPIQKVFDSDIGNAIDVDSKNNIYIGGEGASFYGGSKAVLLKYSPDSILRWAVNYYVKSNSYKITHLKIDRDDNIYLLGTFSE
jgi:intein/homing endonuclease